MKLAIFGGTGTSGLLTIKKALSEGHDVIAYARKPEKITFQHQNLLIVKGELSEYDKIEKVIADCDAVIGLLGPTGTAKATLNANGYKNIINAMKRNNKRRLIAVVSSSYSDPNDRFQFMVTVGVALLRVLVPSILRDIVAMGDLIRNSQLDWTMVRISALKNTPATGNPHIGYAGDGKFNFFELSREDLAHLLVQQLNDSTYLQKAPAVSKNTQTEINFL